MLRQARSVLSERFMVFARSARHLMNDRALLLLWFLLSCAIHSISAAAATEPSGSLLHIQLHGAGGKASETIVSFKEGEAPSIETRAQIDGGREFMVQLLEKKSSVKDERKILAKEIAQKLHKKVAWANISPDHKFALISYDFMGIGGSKAYALIRLPEADKITGFTDDINVSDSAWMPNSQTLLILESTTRLKLSPGALVYALAGHPKWVYTYYLRTVNIASLAQSRIKVADDYENSSARMWLE